MKHSTQIFFLFGLVLLLSACGEQGSDEEQVAAQIDRGIAAIEAKSSGDAIDLVSEEFSGQRDLSKKELQRMMLGYFLRYKDVGMYTAGTQIDIQNPLYAEASFTAVLTGGEHLIPDSARQYQVHSCWRKIDNEWLLSCLEWE